MSYLGDKRYTKIEFDPGEWSPVIGEGGVVTWSSVSPTAGCTVTKSDGGTQPHVNCPVGSTITTTNGTAVIVIL